MIERCCVPAARDLPLSTTNNACSCDAYSVARRIPSGYMLFLRCEQVFAAVSGIERRQMYPYPYMVQERHEVPGAKDGEASIVLKCPLCVRVNSLGRWSCVSGRLAICTMLTWLMPRWNASTCLCLTNHIHLYNCCADIVDDSVSEYTAEHSGQFHKIVSFDCRGVEPFDFDPRVCCAKLR